MCAQKYSTPHTHTHTHHFHTPTLVVEAVDQRSAAADVLGVHRHTTSTVCLQQ